MSFSRKMNRNRKLRFETLEDKRMLAIVWANEMGTGADDPNFDDEFGANEVYAREIVNRAINDWDAVITSFNYAADNDADPNNNLNDTFMLNVSAAAINGRGQSGSFAAEAGSGIPISADITLDDNGGGAGWFFDTTPLDDAEFTGIADAFQASFIDATTVGQANQNDFYRTISHEIGHAVGFTVAFPLFNNLITVIDDPTSANPADILRRFDGPSGLTATLTSPTEGTHLYPGDLNDPIGFLSHPNDLMNPGRTVPAGSDPAETVRQFISDLDVMILADAFGYTVTLPSDLFVNDALPDDEFSTGTAQIVLDPLTDTLLVQGLAQDPTDTAMQVDDTINITIDDQGTANRDDDEFVVAVTYTLDDGTARNLTRRINASRVSQILIAGNGGNDTITIDPAISNDLALADLVQMIDYVVSSNVDALEAAGANTADGIVDVSNIIPGNQTTLRAAIVETNARAGDQSIYLGRGIYNLTLTGSEALGDAMNDLDITDNVTIIGAGAGLSVINADFTIWNSQTRLFDVRSGGTLDAARLTITGGSSTNANGGGIEVNPGGALLLNQVAVVDNSAGGNGGGINLNTNGAATAAMTLINSVLAGNTSGQSGGGNLSTGTGSSLTIGGTIFANNNATNFNDIIIGSTINALNLGNNLIESTPGGQSFFGAATNDIVNSPVDLVVTSIADRIDATDDASALSLREAVIDANANNSTIWLPAWKNRLTLAGTGGDTQGDLDITGVVTIVGAGAGLAVIDATGLGDRVFDVQGTGDVLNLSRATVTGGNAVFSGGGIFVRAGGAANISQAAIVDNVANNSGGGIYTEGVGATTTITQSVIANNLANGTAGGGGIYSTTGTTFDMGSSIVANNSAPNSVATPTGEDIFIFWSATTTSLGNNILGRSLATEKWNAFGATGDVVVENADFIVTSVADTYDFSDDNQALSMREAIDRANNTAAASVILTPAWTFLLTRDRGTNMTDMNVAFGDLDIKESLTIHGIDAGANGATSFAWKAGVTDAVFDLLGDFTGDGIITPDDGYVNFGDFLAWQTQTGSGTTGVTFEQFSADGDDDGDVDGDDLSVLWAHLGNSLVLSNVLA